MESECCDCLLLSAVFMVQTILSTYSILVEGGGLPGMVGLEPKIKGEEYIREGQGRGQ